MNVNRIGSSNVFGLPRAVETRRAGKKENDNGVFDVWLREAEERFARMLDVVRELIEKQGGLASGKLTVHLEIRLEIEKDLAVDGYWGAEQTAGRIIKFARDLAGGDPSKAGLLRDAAVRGFEAAEKALGGLPAVSQKTFELVMKGFEEWASETT